jgi:hypothetical protein
MRSNGVQFIVSLTRNKKKKICENWVNQPVKDKYKIKKTVEKVIIHS